jgi:hypothetical protein
VEESQHEPNNRRKRKQRRTEASLALMKKGSKSLGDGSWSSRAYWSARRGVTESEREEQREEKRVRRTVLGGNINATSLDVTARSEGKNRLIVTTVTEAHPVRVEAGGKANDLVTHADTENGLVPLVDRLANVVRRLHAVLGVTGTVREEETVELVTDGVEVEVPGEDGDGSAATSEGTEDVGLGSEIEESDLDVAVRVEGVDLASRNLVDEVLNRGVPVLGVLGADLVALTDGELRESRTVGTEEGGDGTGVDTGDTRNSVAVAPLVKRLDGLIVRVTLGDVRDDDTGALDAVRLEHDGRTVGLVVGGVEIAGNTVVSDERGGEDEELGAVRRVGHRLGVRGDGGGEDRLSEARDGRAERATLERLAGLEVEGRGEVRVEGVEGLGRHGRVGEAAGEGRAEGAREGSGAEEGEHFGGSGGDEVKVVWRGVLQELAMRSETARYSRLFAMRSQRKMRRDKGGEGESEGRTRISVERVGDEVEVRTSLNEFP